MSGNIIPFPPLDLRLRRRLKQPVWVPEYAYRLIDGIGVPYWTGKETLCKLIKNPAFTGDPKVYPYEIPFNYTVIGKSWDPVQRNAPPPACAVNEFDWDEFERTACRS